MNEDQPSPPKRVQFVVYETATGIILRSGTCAETDLHLQAIGLGESVIEGEGDDAAFEVQNGQIVAKHPSAPEPDPIDQRSAAAAYLADTDWMVIRFMETGTPVPGDVLTRRADARAVLSS